MASNYAPNNTSFDNPPYNLLNRPFSVNVKFKRWLEEFKLLKTKGFRVIAIISISNPKQAPQIGKYVPFKLVYIAKSIK